MPEFAHYRPKWRIALDLIDLARKDHVSHRAVLADDAWQRLELRCDSRDKPLLVVMLYQERYWIEHGYQQLKKELGLDNHEGLSLIGWHRNVLLVFLAYGYLTLLCFHQKKQRNLIIWRQWLQGRSILGRDCFH